ncbi:PTS sugar transporter subunit IIA [Ligilactobacillus sp. MP3]|uniref:PTS sugar transporter subunit IIA n=1 Tax=Ligilactobacillus sp. MP3 TaxID=2965103 RepID=UPI0021099C59|nr:PTS sugar transporter subunit IIA [Ligilactobacillus sp. MP3]MCQ4117146.1 PTS sugar transporter subunit IIA [Ligilactobacillus sp. MP3]
MALIHKDLVFTNLKFDNKTETLNFLSKKLYEAGYAKESFPLAVIDREKIFPTGLPTGIINVAIPHADSEYVDKSALAVATLKNPITFNNMGNPDEELAVSFIIMMAIAEPHGQVTMLQKIMQIIQNQDYLQKLMSLKEDDLFTLLADEFDTITL